MYSFINNIKLHENKVENYGTTAEAHTNGNSTIQKFKKGRSTVTVRHSTDLEFEFINRVNTPPPYIHTSIHYYISTKIKLA
jgi:hypothetical protein